VTRQTRLVLAGTAAALVAAVSLVGGALRSSGGSARAVPVKSSAAGETFAAGFSAGNTASFVRRLVDQLRSHPADAKGYTLLGLAYQQRARETGNPAYYTKSEQALDRARKLAPEDATTASALGSLALARHRFGEAFALGREAVRLAPYTARNYGVLGDALVELGRY
jgi:Flp pilus assembly protein TadD